MGAALNGRPPLQHPSALRPPGPELLTILSTHYSGAQKRKMLRLLMEITTANDCYKTRMAYVKSYFKNILFLAIFRFSF